MKSAERTYTTGEMARLSNTTLRTVRFYEEAGILQPIKRTEGGHRVYDQTQLDRLTWINDMREAGMSLDQIRQLLDTKQKASSGGDAAATASRALETHISELHGKIAVLSRLAADLEQTLAAAKACAACDDATLFPHQCRDCDRLSKSPLPRGMKVLWGVGDAAGAGAEDAPPMPLRRDVPPRTDR